MKSDLRDRIREFFAEIEYTHLKQAWVERIVDDGLDEAEARKWAAEIGHVVEEYESSLLRLADLLDEKDPALIPKRVYSWVIGRLEVTIPEIEEPMRYLKERLEKLLPHEPDDEDE